MNSQLSFEIVTQQGLKFQADIYQVTLPTPAGAISVLPGHMPLITLVVPGVIAIRRHREAIEPDDYLATSGGFADVSGRSVRLLADTVEHADDIDEMKAKEALARAQALQAEAANDVSFADAVGQVELSLASLKVAELRRRRRSI